MVYIEHCTLGAFKQDSFSLFKRVAEKEGGVCDILFYGCPQSGELLKNLFK